MDYEDTWSAMARNISAVKADDDPDLRMNFVPVSSLGSLSSYQKESLWDVLDNVHEQFGVPHGNICTRTLHVSKDGQHVAISGWCLHRLHATMAEDKDALFRLLTHSDARSSTESLSSNERFRVLALPPNQVGQDLHTAWVNDILRIMESLQQTMTEICSLENNYISPWFPSKRMLQQWVRQYFKVSLWLRTKVPYSSATFASDYTTFGESLLKDYVAKPFKQWYDCATHRLLLGVVQAHSQWPSTTALRFLELCIYGEYDALNEDLYIDPRHKSYRLDDFMDAKCTPLSSTIDEHLSWTKACLRDQFQSLLREIQDDKPREPIAIVTGYYKSISKHIPIIEKYVEDFQLRLNEQKELQRQSEEKQQRQQQQQQNNKQPSESTRSSSYDEENRTSWTERARRTRQRYHQQQQRQRKPQRRTAWNYRRSWDFSKAGPGPQSHQRKPEWNHRRRTESEWNHRQKARSGAGSGTGTGTRSHTESPFSNDVLTDREKKAYRDLQLDPNDLYSCDEIKKQYKKLALQYHPDKFSHMDETTQRQKTEMFKEISNAFDILCNNGNQAKGGGIEEPESTMDLSTARAIFAREFSTSVIQELDPTLPRAHEDFMYV